MTNSGFGRRMRCLSLCLAVLPLSACLQDDGTSQADMSLLQRAALANGDVVVVPPQGYCIQGDSLQQNRLGGFALLASCETLGGYVSGYQVDPVVMTVAAIERDGTGPEPTGAEVATVLQGQQVLRQLHGDGLTLVQVLAAAPLSPESDPRHWRGFMVVNQVMVGLALYGPRGSAVSGDKGLSMVIWLAETIREHSPQRQFAPPSDGQASPPGLPRPVARPTPSGGVGRGRPGTAEPKPVGKNIFSAIFG